MKKQITLRDQATCPTIGVHFITIPNGQYPGAVLMDPTFPISLLPGTYYVTLTVTLNGTTYCQDTVGINVKDCCLQNPQAVNVYDNEFTSNLSLPPTATTVISGTLVVDNIYTLPANVTNVIILPNSQIVIKDAKSFTASLTMFKGCGEMWNSFILDGNSSLNLNRCWVKDAWYAISNTSANNTISPIIALAGCELYDNYNDIYLQSCSPVLNLMGNKFYGTPIYPQHLLGSTFTPNVGILLYYCLGSSITGPGMNEFHDVNVGVWSWSSDLFIDADATWFHNFPFSNRVGIASYSDINNITLTKIGNTNSTLDFQNCTWGIAFQNVSAHILSNHMKDVGLGILAYRCRHKTVELANNAISTTYVGIGVNQINGPLYSLDINTNNIDLMASNPSIQNAGILVNQYKYAPDAFAYVRDNIIQVDQGQYGMIFNSAERYRITKNFVKLNDCSTNLAGIEVTSGRANFLQCNSVLGSSPNCSNGTDTPSGLRFNATTDGSYEFNNTDQTFSGVSFDNDCSNTDFNNHNFYSHNLGLYYGSNSNTNAQYHKQNRWLGSYSFSAYNIGSFTNSIYTVGIGGQLPPNPIFPQFNWFVSDNYSEAVGINPCVQDPPPGMIAINPLMLTSNDTAVALNQVTYNAFESEQKWGIQKGLFNKLGTDTILTSPNPLMQNYFDSAQFISSGQYQSLNIGIVEDSKLGSVDKLIIDSLNTQISLILTSIASTNQQLVFDTLLINTPQLILNRALLISQLEGLKSVLSNILQGYEINLGSQVPLLSIINQNLPDTSLYEGNQKLLNGIYLNTYLTGNPLTTTQKIQLLAIATQCPLSGGEAVYLARCLVATFVDTSYNDSKACAEVELTKAIKANSKYLSCIFSYFPNPTSGLVTLTWDSGSDSQATVEILNLNGVTVYSKYFSLNSCSLTLDVTSLPIGTYNIRTLENSDIIYVGKLIIIK